MATTATKLGVFAVIWAAVACTSLAQTPVPGPTAPPKSLPLPKTGDNIVINPTADECKAGWRPGLRWTREEFEAFCRQFAISK